MAAGINQSANGDNNLQVVIKEFHANVANISSILAAAMPKVAALVQNQPAAESDTVPYEIEEKISYNKINSYKEVLNEYAQYGTQIDAIYDEYDNSSPGFKSTALRYFATKYLLIKEELLSLNSGAPVLDVVTANADKIMRDVFEKFRNDLKSAKNLAINLEEIDTCALALTCHAFIQCKILEKPIHDN